MSADLLKAAAEVSACQHRSTSYLGETSMTKRAEKDGHQKDFWPGEPMGVRVPGKLVECHACRALMFLPKGNLSRVTLCVL